MRRSALILLAVIADVVTAVAVFLPWAGVDGDSASVAGWGSAATPRLLGLFVLACAATALSFRSGVLLVGSDDRVAPHLVAIVLDGVSAMLALVVIGGAEAFVGANQASSVRYGALLALAAAGVAVAAGVVAMAVGSRAA